MELSIPTEIIQKLSATQAHKFRAVPISENNSCLELAVDENTWTGKVQSEVEFITNKRVSSKSVTPDLLDELLARYYRNKSAGARRKSLSASGFKAETFLDDLVVEAKDLGSSDIHIETFDKRCRVRIRIDGKLIERYELDAAIYPGLVNKLKIRANLDIAEKRLPQDGRVHFEDDQDKFDIRVSVLPTMFGEKIVLRILHQDENLLNLQKLGLSQNQLSLFLDAIRKPDGIVLISGPTGSGKTTTLYSTLKMMNRSEVNICTVEDPVEYTLEGINQVQVKDSIGLSFASALRSFLRQDPDIIMVGEIRDSETAQMAIRASLTGHQVLSTIHTNSAVDTIFRLVDMGIPEFLIASTLRLSVAQRLVRKLCVKCKTPLESVPEWPSGVEVSRKENVQLFSSKGCDYCHYTGYKGRQAIYEMISISDVIADAIRQRKNIYDSVKSDYRTLSDSVYDMLINGDTSLDEAYSIL